MTMVQETPFSIPGPSCPSWCATAPAGCSHTDNHESASRYIVPSVADLARSRHFEAELNAIMAADGDGPPYAGWMVPDSAAVCFIAGDIYDWSDTQIQVSKGAASIILTPDMARELAAELIVMADQAAQAI